MQDIELKCVTGCGKKFIWTVSEQEFFKEKGLKYAPKKCLPCRRENRKTQQHN